MRSRECKVAAHDDDRLDTPRTSTKRRLIALAALFLIAWLVLYPDPRPLFSSVSRMFYPPIDPAAVTELAATLPDDAAAIEIFSQEYVPYRTAWELYGLPWYYPTVGEVVAKKGGDCQAEALLSASILEAKGMPYTLRYSFEHVWVDYPGKGVTAMEDPAVAFVSDEGQGWLAGLPKRFPVRDIVANRIGYHWDPMPWARKLILLLGAVAALLASERPWRLEFATNGRKKWDTWRGSGPTPPGEDAARGAAVEATTAQWHLHIQ